MWKIQYDRRSERLGGKEKHRLLIREQQWNWRHDKIEERLTRLIDAISPKRPSKKDLSFFDSLFLVLLILQIHFY